MKKKFISVLIFLMCIQAEYMMAQPNLVLDISNDPPTIPPGNPFLLGQQGNWKPKRTYILVMERTQTRAGANGNLNLRKDGTYKNFFPFWNPPIASNPIWTIQNKAKWTFKTQINHYNPFGSFELENVDPLNRYSAAVYGYNNAFPISVAMNARFREIGFDSFEDYSFGRCANNHFSFQMVNNIDSKLTQNTAHSGRYSIRLAPSEVIIMSKEFAPCEEDPRPVVVR